MDSFGLTRMGGGPQKKSQIRLLLCSLLMPRKAMSKNRQRGTPSCCVRRATFKKRAEWKADTFIHGGCCALPGCYRSEAPARLFSGIPQV
ncbi:rCG47935 [Rattus norvegicus]|uniref:RCG47935 n=1 Tax=Rattus norvegicus TaxID=10116 RepID=A6I156_RAT|nr:rCG47935 [Rattus norvegicus]